jgi:hypothetical protein
MAAKVAADSCSTNAAYWPPRAQRSPTAQSDAHGSCWLDHANQSASRLAWTSEDRTRSEKFRDSSCGVGLLASAGASESGRNPVRRRGRAGTAGASPASRRSGDGLREPSAAPSRRPRRLRSRPGWRRSSRVPRSPLVDLVSRVGLVAVDGHDVLTERHFPHVAAQAPKVFSQLDGGVRGEQAVRHPDEDDPGAIYGASSTASRLAARDRPMVQ